MKREDPWHHLRRFTAARIALGRAGGSLPTSELLSFRLAHARARDAVHSPFEAEALAAEISALGLAAHVVRSQAEGRQAYLLRPELGRSLAPEGRAKVAGLAGALPAPPDVALIVSDGLSAEAVHKNAVPFVKALLPAAKALRLTLAPCIVAVGGRVALQDEIGSLLKARLALTILGERPGLGSADSLGAYFVYEPRPGRTDADRNCLSNVRAGGLPPAEAARRALYLVNEALTRRLSGVALKDDGGTLLLAAEGA